MVTITFLISRERLDEALFPNKNKRTDWVPKIKKKNKLAKKTK